MKSLKYTYLTATILLILSSCVKQHFYADPDDPGLSAFTSRQFQTGTCYINDTSYINYWPEGGINIGPQGLPYPKITKYTTVNAPDSIEFSWTIGKNTDTGFVHGNYHTISIKLQVENNFSYTNLLAWEGKRIPSNEGRLDINWYMNGASGIYFVKVAPHHSDSRFVNISGLFNGNIGDSIFIEKGRFDYIVELKGFK